MTIRVVCPNGHALKVKDSFAGKTGLCPACKARVHIPQINGNDMSEDAIMDILGPDAAETTKPAREAAAAGNLRKTDPNLAYKKICHVCNEEIAATTHICPHCHTYIAKLADF